MSRLRLALGVATTAGLVVSCTAIFGIDGEYDLACTTVAECPTPSADCRVAACIQGICGDVRADDGAACGEGLACNTGECCTADDTCVTAIDASRVPCPGTEARGQYDAFRACACEGDCADFCGSDSFCSSGATPIDACLECIYDVCAPACPGFEDDA